MDTKIRPGLEIKVLSNLLKRKVHCFLPQSNEKLTDGERQVIGFLYHNKDKDIFQKDVEVRFVIRRSTASRMLKGLEEKKFITRESVKGDARLKKICLTPMAQTMQENVLNGLNHFEELLCAGISEKEMDTFLSVAEKLKKNLESLQ